MELVLVESDSRWDELLARLPGATLFHTMAWLRFQQSQFGLRLFPLIVRRHGNDVGVFPLFVTRRWMFRVAGSPRGVDTIFLGPLVRDELLGELLDTYERWAKAHRIDYSSIAFAREIDPAVALSRRYVCERHRFSVVDLRGGADTVWGRMKSEGRRRIRQAEKRGVKIVEGDFSEHYDRYVELSAEVFARSNRKTELTRPILSGLIETLGRAGQPLTLRAEIDGQLAGMWFGAAFGKTFYALETVSDRAFKNCSASSLLNWHAMQWCCRHGLEAMDLGGSRIRSLANFKASFGAAEHFYNNIKKPHSPLARVAVWLKDATVNRARARAFFRSQKGKVQNIADEHTGADGEDADARSDASHKGTAG